MNGAKIVENIFFTVTCISVFTCCIRSDYNFAMGLLSYYMIKNIGTKEGKEISKVAKVVSDAPENQYACSLQHSVLKIIVNLRVACFCFATVDRADSNDNHYGHPVDHGHEGGLGRQASQERQRVEGVREHSLHHTLPLFHQSRSQGHLDCVPRAYHARRKNPTADRWSEPYVNRRFATRLPT